MILFLRRITQGKESMRNINTAQRRTAAIRYRPLRYWPLLAALPALCWAAAAPPGTITVLEVTLPSQADLQALVDAGYVIDAVAGLNATVYAAPAEREQLEAAGYPLKVLGVQPGWPERKAIEGYHGYEALTADLQAYSQAHKDICRLSTLGDSVQGRALWAILISDNPDAEEDEPEFKYVATMHGDEPVGTELCLYFIDLLLNSYGQDLDITWLVDNTEIWILPLMNPDGRESGSRANATGADLNRSFPVYPSEYTDTYFRSQTLDTANRPPEVQHVMAWSAANRFVLSANLHTGALVVNYPYDDDGLPSGTDAPTPDDALFEKVARRYARLNPGMDASWQFPGGITNGCAWYSMTGGMQDWLYRYLGCMDLTIELSKRKWPDAATLPQYWADNGAAMLALLEAVHLGVRGCVYDRRDDRPLSAQILVDGNPQPVFTDPDAGDYHRLLLPGQYALTVSAPGYIPYRVTGVNVTQENAVRADVPMSDGDVNLDGMYSAVDVQCVVNAMLGMPGPFDADVDGKGVSATDAQAVVNRALRRVPG